MKRLSAGLALAPAAGRLAAQQPGAPSSTDAKAPPLPPLGSPLALPEVPMLDGSVFLPAAAEGQVLVLYWWASWCPFCAVQSPLMDRLWREQRGRGLQMLGLSIDKKPEDAVAYLAKRGYGFPSGWVTPAVARALPKPKGLPVTVVRGRDGRVLMAEAGQLFPEDVEQISRFL
ncbi:MAG: TlpA disulfide reductase family protein [Rubrivivax sp.]|nr:TlpA disulfide reductase family protein [Rubrivivax sp.]